MSEEEKEKNNSDNVVYYKKGDKILQIFSIEKDKRPLDKELMSKFHDKYGLIMKRVLPGECAVTMKELEDEYKNENVSFYSTVIDNDCYIYSVRNEQPADKTDVPQMIKDYSDYEIFDVFEYAPDGSLIGKILSFYAPNLRSLLDELEVKATKEYCKGKPIDYVINKDNLRQNLDSVIFAAQKKVREKNKKK